MSVQKKAAIEAESAPTPSSQGSAFTKSARVRQRFLYRLAQNKGRRVSLRHFTVMVWVRAAVEVAEERARLGITVSKKVGNAVQRNRVKRVVREVFRRNQTLFSNGSDYVFIAKAGAADLSYAGLLAEVQGIAHALAPTKKPAR